MSHFARPYHNDLNVLTLVHRLHLKGPPYTLYLRRNSWSHNTAFKFLWADPDVPEWKGTPPYWTWRDDKNRYHGSPAIHGLVHWGNRGTYEPHVLSCAGTYAYTPIGRPPWWSESEIAYQFENPPTNKWPPRVD